MFIKAFRDIFIFIIVLSIVCSACGYLLAVCDNVILSFLIVFGVSFFCAWLEDKINVFKHLSLGVWSLSFLRQFLYIPLFLFYLVSSFQSPAVIYGILASVIVFLITPIVKILMMKLMK